MPVQLVIKAPNQKFDDVLIDCELQWDVLTLKNHLSNLYPTNPKPEEQRLIYAGRLLNDHLVIKDFINYIEGQKYILHLVCSQHALSSPTHSSNGHPTSASAATVFSQPSTSLRQRLPSSPLNNGRSSSSNNDEMGSSERLPSTNSVSGLTGPGGGLSPEQMAQQMAAMQQFYVQYMARFMQQSQFGTLPMPYPNAPSTGVDGAAGVTAAPAAGVPAENRVPPPNANRGQAAGNQNVRMNAQGGPLLDDEEDNVDNRDWLDWFYIFSRALVLFAILFFYSSLERFMMVAGIALLIYMYQGGWFGPRIPQPVAPPPQPPEARENVPGAQRDNENPQQAENQEAVSSPEVAQEQGIDDQVDTQNGTDLTDANREPDNDRFLPHLIQTVRICLTSFFVSLIPEQPPPININ